MDDAGSCSTSWYFILVNSSINRAGMEISQLRLGIPISGTWNASTGPRHTTLDPIPPPLLKTDSSVVVVAEQKSARWADFIRSASVCVPRLVGEIRKPANRTNCHRSLQNQPVRVESKPATLRCFVHISFFESNRENIPLFHSRKLAVVSSDVIRSDLGKADSKFVAHEEPQNIPSLVSAGIL